MHKSKSWLRAAALSQTPREDIIKELLERYAYVEMALDIFRDFDFIVKESKQKVVI